MSRETHDTLAAQARERGISLAAMLAEIAEERRRDDIWRSEREASYIEAQDPAARSESWDWDSTVDDGIA